jgi:hypothetical protein
VVVSDKDQKDIKRARKEGRLAEAMLDRRAAMKRYVFSTAVELTSTSRPDSG